MTVRYALPDGQPTDHAGMVSYLKQADRPTRHNDLPPSFLMTRSDGTIWPRRHTTPRAESVVPAVTMQNIAACEAVGLIFWSGHPAASCVWAVDTAQAAHIVRINRRAQESWHACGYGTECTVRSGAEHWSVAADTAALADQLDLWEVPAW